MSNLVDSLVVRKNNFEYPDGIPMAINCDSLNIEGLYWRVPRGHFGCGSNGLLDYDYRVAETGVVKPTLDSLKVIRVRNAQNQVYYVAAADGAATTVFSNLCKACCDDPQVMPVVTIPDIIIEEIGCLVGGFYTYFSVTSPLVGTEKYTAVASVNGVLLPAVPPAGFVSLAAFKTWADVNWAPNTITFVGNKVTLNTAAGTTGSLDVQKQPA